MKLPALWQVSYGKPTPCIKKQRHHFAGKGPYSQGHGLSSSHVSMWELDQKEGRARKNWCYWTVGLEKTLESPLDCKEIKPVNLEKEINPEYSLKRLMLKMKLQYFCQLIWTANSLEKTLMLGKVEGRRRWGWQRIRCLDGITDSMDMNLGKLYYMVRNRETWYAAFPEAVKSQIQLGDWTTTILKTVLWCRYFISIFKGRNGSLQSYIS